MSTDTLLSEAEHHRAAISVAEAHLSAALERQEAASREVKAARLALEKARMAGSGTLAAWEVASGAQPKGLPSDVNYHEYEPDFDPDARHHMMSSDPPCRACGESRRDAAHRGT